MLDVRCWMLDVLWVHGEAYVAAHPARWSRPPVPHSTPPGTTTEISCNLWPPFPLYRVEAASLPATAARRIENDADQLSKKVAMNMAGLLTGESKTAALGGQGCGGKQGGRPGLNRWFGWGFGRAVPDQCAARVRATQRRAFGCSFQEDRSSRRQSAHSSPCNSDGHSRHKALPFLARVKPRNGRRTGEDFVGQNAAFLFLITDDENLMHEAFVSACCVRRASFLEVGSWVVGLARTVTGAGRRPAAAGSMAAIRCRSSSLQVSTLFGWAESCGLRFGAEDEVCWIGLAERMGMRSSTRLMAAKRPRAKSRQGDLFSPFSLLPPLQSPQLPSSAGALRRVDSTTPLLDSPRVSLQPFPPLPSVWGGGRWSPRESGAAERSERG
jgi:hypothetical protein